MIAYDPEGLEYYTTAADFLKEEDIVEVDVSVVGLEGKFRIRALTFAQMEKINQGATIKGNLDSLEFTYLTILEGIVRPKFNREQVRQIGEKNGEIIRELSQSIWDLGRMTPKTFEAYIEMLDATNKPNSKKRS